MTTAEKMARLGARIWNGEEVSAADRLARLGVVSAGATEEQKELAREYLRMQQRDDATYLESIAGWQTQPVEKGGGRETGPPNPVQHPVYGYGQANMQPVSAEPLVGTPEWVEWNRQREQEQLQTQQLLTGKKPADPEKVAQDKAKEEAWVNKYSEIYATLPQETRDAFARYVREDSIDAALSEEDQLKAAAEYMDLQRQLKQQVKALGYDWQEVKRYAQMHEGQKQAEEEAAAAKAYADEHAFGASAGSVGYAMTGPAQAFDLGGQRIGRAITGSDAPINTYSDAQRAGRKGEVLRGTVSGNIRENHGEFAGFVYDTAMSGADSVASLATGPAAAFVLASNAGASTTRQAMDEGATSDQALQLGFAAAVAEGVFEKISLGNLKSFKTVSAKTLKEATKNLLKTMGVNASEEEATEVANILADGLIRMDESALSREGQAAYNAAIAAGASPEEAEKARWKAMGTAAAKQVGLAGLSGALIGFGFGVGGNAVAYAAGRNARTAAETDPQTTGEQGGELAAQKEKTSPVPEMAPETEKEAHLVGTPDWLEEQKAPQQEPVMPEIPGMQISPDGTQMTFGPVEPLPGTPDWLAAEKTGPETAEPLQEPAEMKMKPEEAELQEEDYSWLDTYRSEEEFDPEDGRQAVSQTTMNEVKDLGARYGRKVRFENLPAGENGYYDNATGEIVISSRLAPGQAAMTVMKHELTHSAENGEMYAQLRNHVAGGGKVVNNWLGKVSQKAGKQFDTLEAYAGYLREEYARRGVELDEEGALREAVANFVQDELFASEEAVRELAAGNRSLVQRVLDFIREAIGRVTGSEKAELQKLERMYQKALRETEGESSGGGRQHMFAGVSAEKRDNGALAEAAAAENSGKDPEETRKETGWFRGADDRWRFEIDDSGAKWNSRGDLGARRKNEGYDRYRSLTEKQEQAMLFGGELLSDAESAEWKALNQEWGTAEQRGNRVGDYLEHKALYEAYPQLREMELEILTPGEMPKGVLGYYSQKDRKVVLRRGAAEEMKSSLLHELQHAVQHIEGFANGSSIEYWEQTLEEGGYPMTKGLRDARRALAKWRAGKSMETLQKLDDLAGRYAAADVDELDKVDKEIADSGLEDEFWELDGLKFDLALQLGAAQEMDNPTDLYYNTAGEIEARDTQARARLTAAERKQKKPDTGRNDTVFSGKMERQYSLDIPLEEQIEKAKKGELPKDYAIYFGETGELLQQLGMGAGPLVYTQSHLRNALKPKSPDHLNWHGLKEEQIARIPKELEDPVMVFDSSSQPDSIVVVTSMVDGDRYPIIAAIKPNVDGSFDVSLNADTLNLVTSIYGKGPSPWEGKQSNFDRWVRNEIANYRLLYVNTEKSQQLFSLSGLQLPGEITTIGSTRIIRKSRNIVNGKKGKQHSIDLLTEVNEGIAAEQKRKAEKMAETMDYGNPRAMKRRAGEESYAQLSRRNRQLEEQVKALKEEFRLTQGHRMDAKYIHALAGKLLHDKASGYDRSRFETELTELFEGIANDKEMSWEAAMAQAAGLMRRVLESSSRAEPSLREQDSRYEELYKALGGTIALRPEEYRAVTAAFGKPTGGRILGLRVKQGDSTDRSLDDRNHNELSRSWPEFFGPELTDAEAVFEAMAEARRVVNEKQYVNDYAQEMESAAAEAAQELFEAYMKAPEKHTFADKQAKRLEQVKAAYSERLLRQREQNRESWEKREAKLKGQMERTKAQAAKQVEKAREETAQAKRREKLAVDTQYKKELRRSIEKSRSWFTQVVTRPSNEKKVPRDLMQAAAKVAELVNLMDVDEQLSDTQTQKKLAETLAKIRQVQKSQDYAISSQWAESGVVAMIEELQEELIDAGEYKPLAKMERYQLEAVDKILKAIKHNMTEANKLIDMETRTSVQEFAEEATQEVRMSRGVKEGKGSHARQVKADWQMMVMSPRTFFNSISGWKHGKVDQLRQELNRGQKQMFRLQKEAAAFFEEVTGRENQKKMDAFSGRKAKMVDIGFKDAATGEKVPVSHAQLCSIWMHLQNEQNINHMMHGGLAVPDPELYAAGRTTEAFAKSRRVLLGDPELAMELRGRLEKAMDDYDRAWVKKAKPFFDEWCRQRINETSLKLVGFSKAGIENYFPINSDKNFAERDFSTIIMNGSIEGMGMLKERVAKAANPIMLEDINKVIARQSENVSLYAGLAIPVRNFNRVWNASSAGWEDSLHNAVAHKWGSQAVKYVDDLMGDLNKSPARRKDKSPLSSLLGQVRRNYAQAVLTLNPNSAVSQVSGYPTAASVLGWKAINKGWTDFASMTLPGGRKRLLEQVQAEMAEHSPLGWVRQKGSTQELYDMQANPTWFTKLANKWEPTSKLISWLDRMDENTVAGIWQAAKYAAQEQMGLQPEKTVKGMGVTEQMRAALNTVMEMEAVAEVPLGESRVPYTGDRAGDEKAALDRLLKEGASVERPGFGKVQFTRSGVKHSVFQGNSPAKQAAVAAVRKVIEKGKEIGWDPNHKEMGFDTYTFAAPVTMDGKKAAVAVVVKKYLDRQGNIAYYIHEIYDEKGNFVQLDGETKNSGSIHGLANHASANATAAPAVKASADLLPTASADATAVNKRFESFVDIVAQALGKNKENTAIRFESKAQEEAYWAKVTDLFERAVEETQPNYTPMQQAAIARSPNEINSFATMFKSPTLANANVLMDAIGEYKEAMRTGGQAKQKKAREQLGRAAGAQIVQALLWATISVAAKGIFFAKWDDDRDETGEVTALQTMGNIVYNATGSLVDAASPIGGEMIFDAVASALTGKKYWGGIDNQALDLVGDIIADLNSLIDEGASPKEIGNTIVDLCTAFGVPAIEARNWVKGAMAVAEDIKNREFAQGSYETTATNVAAATGKAIKGERNYDLPHAQKIVDRWYRDWRAKNPEGETEAARSSLKSALRKAHREEYLAADEETRQKMAEVLTGLTLEGEAVVDREYLDKWVFDAAEEVAKPELTGKIQDSLLEQKGYDRMTEAQQVKAEEYAAEYAGYLAGIRSGRKDWTEGAKWQQELWNRAGKDETTAAQLLGEAALVKAVFSGITGEGSKERKIQALVGIGYTRSQAEKLYGMYG